TMPNDFDQVPDPTVSRRGFLCLLGSATIGTFAIPSLPSGEQPAADPPIRTLLSIPTRRVSKQGLVQITWREQTPEGVRTVTWMPSTPAELTEANEFYDRAHQLAPESPLERVADWVKDLFAGSSRSAEEQQLLQAIISAPGEIPPLLNYADWLTAQGNPQGEFVRVDCLLETLLPDDPASEELNRRWSKLYEKLEGKLLKPLEKLGTSPGLENGLVRTVEIDNPRILPRKVKQLFDAAPLLREMTLAGSIDLEEVAKCPQMSQIESLLLSDCEVTDEGLGAILTSPHFQALTDLKLSGLPLSDEVVEQLAQSPIAGRLKRLNLNGCELTTQAIESLARSPGFQQLEDLDLGGNKLDDAALSLLAGCTNLRNVRRLDLSELRVTADGINALIRAAFFPTLEVLDLSSSRLTDPAKIAPFRQVQTAQLRELDLGASVQGDAMLTLLSERPWLGRLTSLKIDLCAPLTVEGIRRLVESPYLGRLAELDIAYARPGLEGVQLLANCPGLTGLRELNLADCDLSADCARILIESDFADSLEELNLNRNPIGDEGALILANCGRLQRLKYLFLTEDDFSKNAWDALQQRFGDVLL
ncbi:MAG: TIGR02996 domain-containing protein, partial [Planctomycetes bacterium]|nr:TIGR02996 domain-containing protein [Planctomycetota bacterium]